MPASARVATRNVAWVIGIFLRRPPISRMSKVWWQAWLTEPAPRKRQALKNACVNRWNTPAVQAPTPRAMTMYPSWEIVE